ncbi:UNVERIFIED_CONTAM: hypothetical protein BEN50_06685 [Euhalothece sp. KZN 001]
MARVVNNQNNCIGSSVEADSNAFTVNPHLFSYPFHKTEHLSTSRYKTYKSVVKIGVTSALKT